MITDRTRRENRSPHIEIQEECLTARRSATLSCNAATAASRRAPCPGSRALWIAVRRCAVVIRAEPIGAPFVDVGADVAESISIALSRAHWLGPVSSIARNNSAALPAHRFPRDIRSALSPRGPRVPTPPQ